MFGCEGCLEVAFKLADQSSRNLFFFLLVLLIGTLWLFFFIWSSILTWWLHVVQTPTFISAFLMNCYNFSFTFSVAFEIYSWNFLILCIVVSFMPQMTLFKCGGGGCYSRRNDFFLKTDTTYFSLINKRAKNCVLKSHSRISVCNANQWSCKWTENW